MKKFTLTAVGKDKTGIVSSVTETLYRHNVNIEDSTMTRLASEFAIILIMTAPDDTDSSALLSDLKEVENKIGLTIQFKEIENKTNEAVTGNHLITVYGADQAGIVYKTAKLLSDNDISITDLESKKGSGKVEDDKNVYIMVIEANIPEDSRSIEDKLNNLAKEIGVHITVKEIEIFEGL